jgi:hypothetical protein
MHQEWQIAETRVVHINGLPIVLDVQYQYDDCSRPDLGEPDDKFELTWERYPNRHVNPGEVRCYFQTKGDNRYFEIRDNTGRDSYRLDSVIGSHQWAKFCGCTNEEAIEQIKRSLSHLNDYYQDRWCYVGIKVVAKDDEDNEIGESDSVWGIEYNDNRRNSDKELTERAAEFGMIWEAIGSALQIGV